MSDASEILNSGPVDKAADLLHRLAGPMFDEFGAMLADTVRPYRVKNLVSTVKKTERILRDAGLPANAVPPRLLLPIVDHCSVEDDETLQEMWAGLLATASQQADVSPSFIETLKHLTPDDARHLERIRAEALLNREKLHLPAHNRPLPSWIVFLNNWQLPRGETFDTFERLGLIRKEFEVRLKYSGGRQPTSVDEALDQVKPDLRHRFVFTQFAANFSDACHGPKKVIMQGSDES